MAPMSASPAPVLSTAVAGNGASSVPAGSRRTPRRPSVRTTAGGCSPPSAASSVSLTTATSKRATSDAGSLPAGAGLMIAVARPARAAASVPSTAAGGASPWVSQTAASTMGGGAIRALAPGMATITFSLVSSTRIRATPVGSPVRATSETPTPASASAASTWSPWASRPQAPKKRTGAPARAAATAWFAPLPPGAYARRLPSTVSPGRGRRST